MEPKIAVTDILDLCRLLGIEEAVMREEEPIPPNVSLEIYLAKMENLKMNILRRLLDANILKFEVEEDKVVLELVIQ
ncbi:hypothetical protein QBE54_08245 [Thermatribacter velox]|uniref:Uncharacterized protein n=1 Tax=Thermatribacter velox TaxID=3039681 RepID=A0ABZ2YBP7_9BACT